MENDKLLGLRCYLNVRERTDCSLEYESRRLKDEASIADTCIKITSFVSVLLASNSTISDEQTVNNQAPAE